MEEKIRILLVLLLALDLICLAYAPFSKYNKQFISGISLGLSIASIFMIWFLY